MIHDQWFLILDFGSQFTQLIARRLREKNVYCEIHPHTFSLDDIKGELPAGIILSGGPMSVYEEDSPDFDQRFLLIKKPVLGICYGLQLLAKQFGAKTEPAKDREYGRTQLDIKNFNGILSGVRQHSIVWMSHGDLVSAAPKGFDITAVSENTPVAVIENPGNRIYGLQFHPEVIHTQEGSVILDNFIFKICAAKPDWKPGHIISGMIEDIRRKTNNGNVLCALSGGVDSSVAAVLVHKSIGSRLKCVHIDTGMMRKNESSDFVRIFREKFSIEVIHINAEDIFLARLKDVADPEHKRKIIGNTFIELFEEEAGKLGNVDFLVQGTLYPDVIESVSVKGKSVTIKTHHNVGGLPDKMNLKLIEPFRELFKDEVREIGRELGIPESFISRHPFPGPGLAVRVLGAVTPERLNILREADDIYISALHKYGIYDEIWQAFGVLLPVQSVGVMGDARTYENVLALRAVTSVDGMTADWYHFGHDFLAEVSNLIIRSVRGINRVVYDISSKPPSTIEWE
ncbi:MAG: glutamine-hydrolyzing GMP synthase [Ignavibacteriales bacterium]|nr:glutamine-hydrolyzing GMP synthase [Ignavibacteriales bacterium]MCF8316088.1 glutamine-hydrolyzing GMP synthase [Ignavibacteriales bacterium]MCF8436590.1 glutamine-hydrolyzing GMP synthase [Ignavibacteriales bacterium]